MRWIGIRWKEDVFTYVVTAHAGDGKYCIDVYRYGKFIRTIIMTYGTMRKRYNEFRRDSLNG